MGSGSCTRMPSIAGSRVELPRPGRRARPRASSRAAGAACRACRPRWTPSPCCACRRRSPGPPRRARRRGPGTRPWAARNASTPARTSARTVSARLFPSRMRAVIVPGETTPGGPPVASAPTPATASRPTPRSCEVDSPSSPPRSSRRRVLEQEPRDGVEGKEHGEDLPVVALARVHADEADGGDRERRRGLVDLRGVHRQAPHAGARQQVVAELLLARGAPPGKRHGPRQVARRSEAAAGEQAAHAAEGEAERDRRSPPCRRPSRTGTRSRAEQPPRRQRRADEAAVVREPAGPELRPGEAVGFLRVAQAGAASHTPP